MVTIVKRSLSFAQILELKWFSDSEPIEGKRSGFQ